LRHGRTGRLVPASLAKRWLARYALARLLACWPPPPPPCRSRKLLAGSQRPSVSNWNDEYSCGVWVCRVHQSRSDLAGFAYAGCVAIIARGPSAWGTRRLRVVGAGPAAL